MRSLSTQKITSFSNPKVRYVQNLKDKKFRDKEGRIFVEGFRELKRAYTSILEDKNTFQPEILCISPDCFLGENEWDLISNIVNSSRSYVSNKSDTTRNWEEGTTGGFPVWEFPRSVFEKMSYRDRPDGLIAIAKAPDHDYRSKIGEILSPNSHREDNGNPRDESIILVIEGVEKPGNLGTILRTAEGAGVTCVVVTDARTDVFGPNTIRSSTGVVFHIPVVIGDSLSVLQDLQARGYKRYALTPEASSLYTKADLRGKVALIFGSEQYGLSEIAKKNSDGNIYIPMLGEADSLNLAQSCGIVVYEALRQKSM